MSDKELLIIYLLFGLTEFRLYADKHMKLTDITEILAILKKI